MADYALMPSGMVWRQPDGPLIPQNADNADYQAYLAWVAAGGVPDPPPRFLAVAEVTESTFTLRLVHARQAAQRGDFQTALLTILDIFERNFR